MTTIGQECREHLDDQQEQHAGPSSTEAISREGVGRERRHREASDVATPEMRIELKNQFANAVLLKRFSKLYVPNSFGISDVELSVPGGLRPPRSTNRTGMIAKMHRQDRDDVPPADGAEPALASHRLISSRAAVRRKPMIETVATMMKMSTDTAAAKPYCAPPSANASR